MSAQPHSPSVEERIMYLEEDLALVALLAEAMSQAAGAGRDVDLGHRMMADAWQGLRRRCDEANDSYRAIRKALGAAAIGKAAPSVPDLENE